MSHMEAKSLRSRSSDLRKKGLFCCDFHLHCLLSLLTVLIQDLCGWFTLPTDACLHYTEKRLLGFISTV